MKKAIILFGCGILIIIGVFFYITKQKEKKEQYTVFEQIGLEIENIEEIWLSYRNQKVLMTEQAKEDFLDSLSHSEAITVEDNHEFTASKIEIIFVANEVKYPVTFYWFPYYLPTEMSYGAHTVAVDYNQIVSEANKVQLIGNRFDITMDGKKYHYRFITEKVLTEDLMCSLYDKCAIQQNLLSRAKLDGADESFSQRGLCVSKIYTLEEVLSESDLIFIGTYERTIWCQDMAKYMYSDMDQFHIDEVLKGETIEEWYMFQSDFLWDCYIDGFGKIQIADKPVYSPAYQIGESYLICVNEDSEGENKYFGQYGTAVIDGDTLFPRFNTEEHPFYNIELQTIREYLSN